MGRVVIGAFLAAIVIFVWGFVAWPGLHLYSWAFKSLSNEEAVVSTLAEGTPGEGAYFIPSPEHREGMTSEEKEAAEQDRRERHTRGPIALLIYRPDGADPMNMVLPRGFGITFLGAVLLGLLMRCTCCGSYFGRVGFAIGVGLFAVLITHGITWNYFHAPNNYTLAMMMDGVIAWTLGGLVLAAFVKPCGAGKAAQSPA